MNLSRKWLTEFVDGVSVSDIDDREFAEAMRISARRSIMFWLAGYSPWKGTPTPTICGYAA